MQFNKPIHTLTIKELREQESEILTFLADDKNTPDDIRVMRKVLKQITEQIALKTGPVTPAPTPPPPSPAFVIPNPQPIKATHPPLELGQGEGQSEIPNPQSPIPNPKSPIRNPKSEIPITVRTPGSQQAPRAIPATIYVDHAADPFNPVVKVLWDDGYTFSGDEATIRAQFLSRLQDTANLRDAKDPNRRQKQMWRWDAPWRSLGLLQALIYFNSGQSPDLAQLGVDRRRVSNLFVELFNLITHAADTPAKAETK